jgi:hypothetical protein
MVPTRYSLVERPGDEQAFRDWRDSHGSQPVLHLRTSTTARLHRRADCGHLTWKSRPDYAMTRRPKICGGTEAELRKWALENQVEIGDVCRSCGAG